MRLRYLLLFVFMILLSSFVIADTTRLSKYDFANNQSGNTAFECRDEQVSDPPPHDTGPIPDFITECNGYAGTANLTDSNIGASDNLDETIGSGTVADYEYISARFTVVEDINRINSINWSWEGEAGDATNTVYFYWWNETMGDWKQMGTTTSTTDVVISNVSSSPSDFINGTGVTHTLAKVDYKSSTQRPSTDYMQLVINHTINYAPASITPILNSTSLTNKTVENLSCYFTPTDADPGDVLNASLTWIKDDVNNLTFSNISVTNGTRYTYILDAANTTRGEVWTCQVLVCDDQPECTTPTNSTSLTILNSVPTISGSLVINNTSPASAETLECDNSSITISDDDAGESFLWSWDWLKDGITQGINNKILGPGNTTANDLWRCRVWVGDGTDNSTNITSSSVSVGSSFNAPSINWTNATSSSTGVASLTASPTNTDDTVNLSVIFSDLNTDENHTAYFCKTNDANSLGCVGGKWCNAMTADTSQFSLDCTMSTSSLLQESYDYYGFIVDNNSLVSSSSTGSFKVNHPPTIPTLSTPTNASWININNSLFTASSSDSDSGDTLNYTFYCSNSSSTRVYHSTGTSTTYNYTALNETDYYCAVTALDNHGYASANSTARWVRTDYTQPNITSPSVSPTSFLTTQTTTISFNCTDARSGVDASLARINLTDVVGDTDPQTPSNVSGKFSKTYAPSGVPGTYNVTGLACADNAGNLNMYVYGLTFTTTSPESSGGGGGGTSITIQQVLNESRLKQQTATGCIAIDDQCVAGEDPLNCPEDCKVFDLDEILCWPIPDCGNWKHAWFINGMLILVIGGIGYSQYRKGKLKLPKLR